ncbi:DsbA family protein [Cronobacter turicensis]
MSNVKKIQIIGPLLVGCMVAIGAGGSIYAAVKGAQNEKELGQLKGILTELNNSVKSIQAEQVNQSDLLKKHGGGNGDMVAQVSAALEKIDNEKNDKQQAELYKNWNNTGESQDGHFLYGDTKARFTLVNYSDLECPFCERFHETPKYLVDSAKNGMVNWEWRHYPLSFHEPLASKAAMMGECIAQQKGSKGFWAFTEYWFSNTAGNGQGFSGIDNIPSLFDVDKLKFEKCMVDPVVIKKIKDDMQAGNEAGVTGTPATIIIDNQTGKTETIVGAQPFSKFVEAIESMAFPEKSKDKNAKGSSQPAEDAKEDKK